MDALFNVYKPRGPTSHDVVSRLRRASKIKRIGHAGTLDPMAEGVLLIAVGRATRVVEYLADQDKAYLATVRLGVQTDTYDAEGRVVSQCPTAHVSRDDVEQALRQFRGAIEQRPPAYSAISVGGERLYQRARRGEPVEAPVRRVEIHELRLTEWAPPDLTLHVECSKGTYIRSLAHDLGEALGCGAHLSALVRLRVGTFLAHNAVPLEELEERLRNGRWQAVALPMDAALAAYPSIHLDVAAVSRLANGIAIPDPGGESQAVPDGRSLALDGGPRLSGRTGGTARAYGPDGALVAIVSQDMRDGKLFWRPEKVLAGGG